MILLSHSPQIPGRIRPGLIEAGLSPCSSCGITARGIPGRIRPGLIEAVSCDYFDAVRSYRFRGEFAPASLKPCPAITSMRCGATDSGANSPRPH